MQLHFTISRWNNLREMVDHKRDDINVAHGFQNFNIECNETIVSFFFLSVDIFVCFFFCCCLIIVKILQVAQGKKDSLSS